MSKNSAEEKKRKKSKSNKLYRESRKGKFSEYMRLYAKKHEERLKEYRKQYYLLNKDKMTEAAKQRREERGEELRAKARERYITNREAVSASAKRYREMNKEKVTKMKKEWTEKNKPKIQKRLQVYNKNRTRAIRVKVIEGYGGSCECCGVDDVEFLTIDHTHAKPSNFEGDRKLRGQALYKVLIENKFPKENHRLLCMNCNFAKGKSQVCPHERQLAEIRKYTSYVNNSSILDCRDRL